MCIYLLLASLSSLIGFAPRMRFSVEILKITYRPENSGVIVITTVVKGG